MTEPTVLFSGTTGVRGIAQDDTNVYWADSGEWTIDAIPKTGGARVVLAQGQWASALDVQDGLVYWGDQSSIATVPSVGGAVHDLASAAGAPWAIAVADGIAYWTTNEDTTVRRDDGSPNGAVVADVGEPSDALVATATDVFWTSFESAKLYRYSIADAVVTTLGTPPAGESTAVATDGVSVYWNVLLDGAHQMAIYRVPITGGEPTVVTTIALGQCVKCWASLTSDGAFVYFTDAVEDGNGSIRRVPVTGGPVTILADHQDWPYTIAVDDACVYWNNAFGVGDPSQSYGHGAMMVAPK